MRSDTYAASPQTATTPLMAGAFWPASSTTPGTGAAPGMAEETPASVLLAAALRRSASGKFFLLITLPPNTCKSLVAVRKQRCRALQESFIGLLLRRSASGSASRPQRSAWESVTPPLSHGKRTTEALAAALGNIR